MLLAFLIEWAQVGVDRTPQIGDLVRDILGSLVTLAFFTPSRSKISKTGLHIFQFSVILMILLVIFPLATALIDEAISRKQFPVLADFETPFEISRWEGTTNLRIDQEKARHGKLSLRVELATDRYSAAELKYLPSDWRDYSSLQFSVFNSSSDPLKIHCGIFDTFHITNRDTNKETFYDRFNSTFTLSHGWNDIKISLDHMARAQRKREIDPSDIRGFDIMVMRLPRPEVIYVDYVRLVK